jgi:endoglucanase
MDLLKKICLIPSPSGDEHRLIDFLSRLPLKNFRGTVSRNGSIIFRQLETNPDRPTVLLDAHVDQVHLRVLRLHEENNTVIAQPVGFEAGLVRGTAVTHFDSGHLGIVHRVAPHFKTGTPDTVQTVHIEFGLSQKLSRETFLPGDGVVFQPHFVRIGRYLIGSSGLDNKVSVFVLIQLLEYFDRHPEQLGSSVIFSFTSREEIGLGDFGPLLDESIDDILVLDATPTTDQFDQREDKYSLIQQSSGPVVSRDFEDSRSLGREIIDLARKLGVPIQISFSSGVGSSNSHGYARMYHARVQSVSVPVDNMHSYTETADIRDINACFRLVREYLTGGRAVPHNPLAK